MDEFQGYVASWSGFVDYTKCYHHVSTATATIQILMIIGTAVSSTPQIWKVVQKRTSFGLSGLFSILTSISHVLVIVNYICLHSADFVGLIQIPAEITWKRFLSLTHFFSLWVFFYPIITYLVVFADKENRRKGGNAVNNRSTFIKDCVYLGLYLSLSVIIYAVFIAVSMVKGFGTIGSASIGKIYGTISSLLSVIHYLPQFYETCKIKSAGSLSIVMLMLQSPGGMVSAIAMAVGQHEHWTTFMGILCSAVQQLILLIICIYFECCRKKTLHDTPLISGSASTSHYVKDI